MFECSAEELLEDVELICANVAPKIPPPPSTIRSLVSPILRKWLVENGVAKLPLEIQRSLKFETRNHHKEIRLCDENKVEDWIGFLNLAGIGLPKIVMKNHAPFVPDQEYPLSPIKVKHFTNQKIAYSKGTFITRKEAILILAENLGGAHLPNPPKTNHWKQKAIEIAFSRGLVVEYLNESRTDFQVSTAIGHDYETAVQSEKRDRVYSVAHLGVLDTAYSLITAVKNSCLHQENADVS